MKKAIALCLIAISVVIIQGCGSGEITEAQQKAKADSLEKYAKDHKPAEPREDRGRN